jgi:hypothetical protein
MGALATTLQSSGNDNENAREDKQQVPLSDPPFFRLPGELRNRVYEYALTTDKTLRFIGENSGEKPKLLEPDSRHTNGEYNQLKYTCRKLYQETAGLEAKFNKIEIVSRRFPKAEPARLFRIFLTTSAPEKAAWFTNVTMKSSHCGHDKNKLLEPASDLLPIADFCRRNPHVNIRYIPGGFEYELYSIHHFAAAGLFINKAVHQCNRFPSDPAYNLASTRYEYYKDLLLTC